MWIKTPELSKVLPNIACHGSHNSSIVLEYQGKILEIIEIERLINEKNAGWCQYKPIWSRHYIGDLVSSYIKNKYGFTDFGTVIHQHCTSYDDKWTTESTLHEYYTAFKASSYHEMKHHEAHTAGTFYQSSFNNAIAVSFDGGGNDGIFNLYLCDREMGLSLIDQIDIDLGYTYMQFGDFIKDIRREPSLGDGNLVYAGKILGYQSYGEVREEWLPHFIDLYKSKKTHTVRTDFEDSLNKLSESIGVIFDGDNRLEYDVAKDVAATSQAAFEEVFFSLVDKHFREYDLPICITGGCGLNIVLNSKVKERYGRDVFVGVNPSDCGISTGMMLHCLKPAEKYDVSYLGIEVLDKDMLYQEVEERCGEKVSVDCIVDEIYRGRIVGIFQNRSEAGPRALGNRSIMCSPTFPNMKDILNKKVKDREWYRPFAPIVRLEDVSKYFEWEGPSEFMSFCPKVRDEYREVLPSITHVDGTARVQTITRDKNPLVYDMLTLMAERTEVGVLINTSFNINGKPIVSSYRDAFKLYDNSEMDSLYLNGYYFRKTI
jgi:carbamoyltransferase